MDQILQADSIAEDDARSQARQSTLPAWLCVGAILVCLVAEAALLRDGIDDLDEGYFVQQAARVLHGQLPYRDFQTLYSPGLAYAHAVLFAVLGGPSLVGPRALALGFKGALALLLYLVARPLVRHPLWAAAPGVFLLIGLDDAPVRWEPHPGWPSTCFAVLAAWCLSRAPSARWLVAGGLAAGTTYLFKQNTGVFILAAIVLWALSNPLSRWERFSPGVRVAERQQRPRLPRHPHPPLPRLDKALPAGEAAALAVGAFAAVTLAWLVPLVIALNGEVGELGVLVGAVNESGLLAPPEAPLAIPLGCLVGGVWLLRRSADPRLRWILLAGTALFLTELPRMDALHLAWSAPLLLAVGAAALSRVQPLVAAAAVAGAITLAAPTLASRIGSLAQPRSPIAGVEALPSTAADLHGVVSEIQQRTQPGEAIFVYPTSPLLYVLADRPNATRFDHLNPGAANPNQIQRVIADLSAANVRLVIISDYWRTVWGPPGPNAALEAWLNDRYTEVARHGAYRALMPDL